MSEEVSNPEVEALLEQGIKAARAGDNATARKHLERVVELDQYNEKGWFWLAAVVDSVEEKRVCLGNVIVINPNNRRAQNLLNRLEEEEIPQAAPGGQGMSRRSVILAVGISVAALIFLAVVLVAMLLSGGGDDDPQPTGIAALSTADATEELPEPTREPTQLPATWTPAPTPTSLDRPTATPLAAAPSTVGGTIIMQSGLVVGDDQNQAIWITRPDGSNPRRVTPDNDRGHAPVLSPDGSRYAYIRFATGTREVILVIDNLTGTDTRWASALWGGNPILLRHDTPAWSHDGVWIAFAALGPGVQTPDLYRVSTVASEPGPDVLEQLTYDEAAESWPAFAPDDQSLAYVAQYVQDGETVTELRHLSLTNGFMRNLTSNGAELIESAPDWSPDGQYIVFEGRAAGETTSRIYRISVQGGEPEVLIESDGSDIRPRYSPDGRHIVFSSNRTGNWDVFIYELETGTTYQVTSGSQIDIANDWRR